MTDRISLVLVEDHAATRGALREMLELDGFEVLGAFGTGEEALASAPRLHPDVALVDLGLPGLSGVEVIRGLRRSSPETRALVLSIFEDAQHVLEAIRAGAAGYLHKDPPAGSVGDGIRAILAGHAPLSPEIAGHLLSRVRDAALPEQCLKLSEREREVLALLARGHAYADAARALGIHLSTVQSHVRNIYRKLEVSSKAEAAVVALRYGLVES